MTQHEKKACSYAREKTAQHYAQLIAKDGWTVTHTEGEFTRFDLTITATDGDTWQTETKIRDIDPYRYINEGAVVDKSKVEYLTRFQKALIVQFFPIVNEVYIWRLSEKDAWRCKWGYYQKDDYSGEKVYKQVCLLPLDAVHRKHCDMSDYNNVFQAYKTEFYTTNTTQDYER